MDEPATPRPGRPRVGVLTPAHPVLRVEAGASRQAETATIEIASIDNPAAQEFVLVVLLRGAGGRTVDAGGFGPYPPDRPGTFSLRIPESARNELGNGPIEIVVRLEPADEERELDPGLDVVVRSVRLETPG